MSQSFTISASQYVNSVFTVLQRAIAVIIVGNSKLLKKTQKVVIRIALQDAVKH